MSRTALHAAAGLGLVAFAFLDAPWAIAFAAALVAHNLWLLPRIAPQLMRPPGPHPDAGIVTYPIVVLVATCFFRDRLDLAAAVWAILAFGDSAASAIGRRAGRHRLPWNPEKSWEGLGAFVLAAASGALLAQALVAAGAHGESPGGVPVLGPVVGSALAAGLAETLTRPWNDNLRLGAAATAVLALAQGG